MMRFDWVTAIGTSIAFTAFIAAILAICFASDEKNVEAGICAVGFVLCASLLAGILGGA